MEGKVLDYCRNWVEELQRPQVLLGLVIFTVGAAILWHAWKDPDHNAPWPLGAWMPF